MFVGSDTRGNSASVVAVLTVVCGLLLSSVPLFAQAGQAANFGANAAIETDISERKLTRT
jgi:hypothetical protein